MYVINKFKDFEWEWCEYKVKVQFKMKLKRPWRRGVVVIVSANRTEDRGFESRQNMNA
jgi:hypothetical protein